MAPTGTFRTRFAIAAVRFELLTALFGSWSLWATVAAALWFELSGTFGTTAVTLFAGFSLTPSAATAGLAMMPALLSSLAGALADPDERLGAVFALLLTAADIHLLGNGASCRGLVLGALTSRLPRRSASDAETA